MDMVWAPMNPLFLNGETTVWAIKGWLEETKCVDEVLEAELRNQVIAREY